MNAVSNHCTPGHCIWPYKPESDGPRFEILETDTLGIKEAKKACNSSPHDCHPNYMTGMEHYRIMTTYEKEYQAISKLWQEKARQELGIFSTYYDDIKSDENEFKERQQILANPSFAAKLIENEPHKAHALTAVIVAGVAIFFFAMFFPKAAIVAVPLICIATAALVYKFYNDSKTVSENTIES